MASALSFTDLAQLDVLGNVPDYEYLRMRYFVEHGHVSVWDSLAATGSERQGHKITVETELVEHSELLQRTFARIKKTAEGKADRPSKPTRYGRGYVLLIVFDDWHWFGPDKDVSALRGFVGEHVVSLPLNFDRLYVIGLSGNTCEHFSLPPSRNQLSASQ